MSEEKKGSIRDAFAAFLKDPDLKKQDLVCALEKIKTDWHSLRKLYHDRVWRDSVAFYSGNHYIRDIQTSNTAYRVRVRENHINNVMARLLSIVSQNLPIVRVFPSTDEHDDVDNAQNTEKYGKYFWRTKKLEQQFVKYIKYGIIFGNGFFYRQWDPDLGGKMELGASETKSGDEETRLYQGDISTDVVDPFKTLFRPGIEEMDDMYDFVISFPVNKSMLEKKFGSNIDADPAKALNAYSGETRIDDELVLQHHYYHAPKNWFEEGMYASWCGKTLLKAVTFPYDDGKLPLHHLPFDKPPLGFYGISGIEQVMDLQEQLNRAASMIIEARNLMSRPRVVVSHEAKVAAQSISDRPGDILRFALAGGAPKFETPNFNFAEMAAHKTDLRNALSSVVGITGASRGEIPQTVKTALGLQLVLEQDRSQYAPFIKQINQSMIDVFYGIFGFAAQFIPESDPRAIKIDGPYATSGTFHGGMVPSPLDIYLEDTNPLGWTATARAERVDGLIARGVMTDKNQILDVLKLNIPDSQADFARINKETQQKENDLLSKGEIVPIGPEDDDAIHLDEIAKVIASFGFRKRPKAARDAFLHHDEAHKLRRAKAMASMPAQPTPGGAPKAGGNTAQMAGMLQPPDPAQAMEGLLNKK